MSGVRHGGRVLADQLALHGCELVFAVPGESYLPVLDGLHDHRHRIRVVTCRLENAAANAAEAVGKLTGRPGVCLVTRGPGATQAAVGVHTARQDSTPMLLFVGQVARGQLGREAFQEIDCAAVFGTLAKAVIEVRDPERIPELVARAYAVACEGRPGPVVVDLPEDVLSAEVDVADAAAVRPVTIAAAPEAMDALGELLATARRPLVLAGGGPWDADACEALRAWAQRADVPVAASFRRQDILDNDDPRYVGDVGLGVNPQLRARVQDADVLIALGTRLSEVETQGYTVPRPPGTEQALVHVHPEPDELGRVYQPRLAIAADVRSFATALTGFEVDGGRWASWRSQAREEFERWSTPVPRESADGVDLGAVVAHLRATLSDDAIVCNGAGNYTVWVHRFYRYRGWPTQLAPQSGAMGYGMPAALAAALVHPGREVVALAGDGCFQMCGQELATIASERLPVIVIVADNGMLGTIRMHQERRFPGRVIATDLVNPDFAALAQAYGVAGEWVRRTEDFPDALARARAIGGPALIALATDRRALTPAAELDADGRL